jgi:tryptophan-rich sensory protein
MSQRTLPSQVIGFLVWLAIVSIAAVVGAVGSNDASTFYTQLTRPHWAPPPAVFGPVWSTLYLLMAISAWLVWRERGTARLQPALTLFVVQLCANALWSWLFFAWRMGALAFAEVLVLFVLIAITISLFWRISRLAAVLLLPYLGWVAFASALTWSVWQSNPGLL